MSRHTKGKKNRAQIEAYKNTILRSKTILDDTDDEVKNFFLVGSDDYQACYDELLNTDQEKPIPVPLHIRVGRWLKKKGLLIPIVSALVTFGVWTVNNIFENQKEIAVLSERVANLSSKVGSIEASAQTKELIELQLENVKQEIRQETVLSIKEIESQLDIIEMQISNMVSE